MGSKVYPFGGIGAAAAAAAAGYCRLDVGDAAAGGRRMAADTALGRTVVVNCMAVGHIVGSVDMAGLGTT